MDADPDSPVDRYVHIVESTELDELSIGDGSAHGYDGIPEYGMANAAVSVPVSASSSNEPASANQRYNIDAASSNPPPPGQQHYFNADQPSHSLQPSVSVRVPPSKYQPLPYATARSGLVYDVRMRFHEDPWESNHPEDPRRIASIFDTLIQAGLAADPKRPSEESEYQLVRILPRLATPEEICLVHSAKHVDWVQSLAGMSYENLKEIKDRLGDPNSIYVNNLTWMCALLSTGGSIEATKAVVTGQVKNAIALVRPPGHHAEHDRAEGFCFFNNVPIAAKIAQIDYPEIVRKVLILDWDVHHGNGIQRAFYDDPNVLYISLHVYLNGAFYPGSTFHDWGDHVHCGEGRGLGYNVNIPWSAQDMGDAEYIYAFQQIVMPIAVEFDPDLVFISAGFDAAEGDPLGGCHVSPACYGHMTHMLMQLAKGKLVSCLEGGYNLDSIAKSALSMTRVMMGEPPDRMLDLQPSGSGVKDIQKVIRTQARFWKCMYPKDRATSLKRRLGSERLHDIIREWQSDQLWHDFSMSELFVLREEISRSFEKQVLATENYWAACPLLVIFHDPPEAMGLPDTLTNQLDLHNTWLTDVSKTYVSWAVQRGWAVIDVNIPRHITKIDVKDTLEYVDLDREAERIEAVRELAHYLWDNYISMGDSTHIFLMGIGDAHCGIVDLFSKHRDAVHKIDYCFGFIADNTLPRINRPNDPDEHQYYYHSTVYVAHDHPAYDPELRRPPKRKNGRTLQSPCVNIQEMLEEHRDDVIAKLEELTEDWTLEQKTVDTNLSNGGSGDIDVTLEGAELIDTGFGKSLTDPLAEDLDSHEATLGTQTGGVREI